MYSHMKRVFTCIFCRRGMVESLTLCNACRHGMGEHLTGETNSFFNVAAEKGFVTAVTATGTVAKVDSLLVIIALRGPLNATEYSITAQHDHLLEELNS